jgi:hypothetical protein
MRGLRAVEAAGFEGLPRNQEDKMLVWLCHINKLLPYQLRLSDTEMELLAEGLAKMIGKVGR